MTQDQKERALPYIAGVEPLLNAAGQTVQLDGPGGAKLVSWSPKSKRALDLELRIQPQSVRLAGGGAGTPRLYYSLEIAHGDNVYAYPFANAVFAQGAPQLPHRGLVSRFTAREVRVSVWFGRNNGDQVQSASVKVSVQPALASIGWPQIVPMDLHMPITLVPPLPADSQRSYPMDAREWRVRGTNGLPVPVVAGVTVTQYTLNGIPFNGPVNVADYWDWNPIPLLAAFWDFSGGTAAQVEYR